MNQLSDGYKTAPAQEQFPSAIEPPISKFPLSKVEFKMERRNGLFYVVRTVVEDYAVVFNEADAVRLANTLNATIT